MVLRALHRSVSLIGRLSLLQVPNSSCIHLRFNTCPPGNTRWSYSHASLADVVGRELIIQNDFVSEEEEQSLVGELDVYLQKHKYQSSHWDYAIKNYRETERKTWKSINRPIIDRLRGLTHLALESPTSCTSTQTADQLVLPMVHVLDVAESGEIMPHVDSVRYCGDCIAVISLLSDSILRLSIAPPDEVVGWPVELTTYLKELKLPKYDVNEPTWVDILVPRRSVYVMSKACRYLMTHAILSNDMMSRLSNLMEDYSGLYKVCRRRRISVICRTRATSELFLTQSCASDKHPCEHKI